MNFAGSLEMSKSRSRVEADNALCKFIANQRGGYVDSDFQAGSNQPEFSILAPFPQLSRSSQIDPHIEEITSTKLSPPEFKKQMLHPSNSFSTQKITPLFEEKPTMSPTNLKPNSLAEKEPINLIPSPSFELPNFSYTNIPLNCMSNFARNSFGNLSTHQFPQFSPLIPSNQSSLTKPLDEKSLPDSLPKNFNKKGKISPIEKNFKEDSNPFPLQPVNSSKHQKSASQDRKKARKSSEASNSACCNF